MYIVMGAVIRGGGREDFSFTEQSVQQELDRRGEGHSSHEEQHVQKYGAKRGFLAEEEQVGRALHRREKAWRSHGE